MLLADLGAEVIRVENPWAFPSGTRGVYPRPSPQAVVAANNLNMSGYPDLDPGNQPWNRSAVFNWHGRNKRSATLDIRKPSVENFFSGSSRSATCWWRTIRRNCLDRAGPRL